MVYVRQKKSYKEICLGYDLCKQLWREISKQLWRENKSYQGGLKKYIRFPTHLSTTLTVFLTYLLRRMSSSGKGNFLKNNIIILAI